ncbi:hypothetical protein PybrP1_010368 [[Pythium] brassicae (nom. inval.)]|nr:hypothetical protein PybrP1_010368 [[Pythium] brassicae (nom. inval.)]
MKTPVSKSVASASVAAATAPTPSSPPAVELTDLASATIEVDNTSSALLATVYEPPRRKLACNPTAGDVHRRERGAPWRVEVDEKIRAANARARDEQLEKRRWGLAKQIQDGLVHTFGVNYGVAELATLLKTGIALKAQPTELASHDVAFVQLLAAAEKYDLKQIVVLLERFPKGRNAGAKRS